MGKELSQGLILLTAAQGSSDPESRAHCAHIAWLYLKDDPTHSPKTPQPLANVIFTRHSESLVRKSASLNRSCDWNKTHYTKRPKPGTKPRAAAVWPSIFVADAPAT